MNNAANLFVDVLGLHGSDYQLGLKQGREMETGDAFYLQKEMTQHVNGEEASEMLEKCAPNLLQELKGLASGCNMPLQTILKMFSGYDVAFPEMGCTAFA